MSTSSETAALNALKAKVEAATDPKKSAVTLICGVADLLDGLSEDPVAIRRFSAEMRATADALGDAHVANTTVVQHEPPRMSDHGGTPAPGGEHHLGAHAGTGGHPTDEPPEPEVSEPTPEPPHAPTPSPTPPKPPPPSHGPRRHK